MGIQANNIKQFKQELKENERKNREYTAALKPPNKENVEADKIIEELLKESEKKNPGSIDHEWTCCHKDCIKPDQKPVKYEIRYDLKLHIKRRHAGNKGTPKVYWCPFENCKSSTVGSRVNNIKPVVVENHLVNNHKYTREKAKEVMEYQKLN